MLLNRPVWHTGRVETVNDINAWLTNFWRAVKADPDAVAYHADWPVNEIDLAARRDWLFAQKGDIAKMETDPNWYDAKLAGVWVWGVCSTIGNSWKARSTQLGPPRGVQRARTHRGDMESRESLKLYLRDIQRRIELVTIMCGDWSRVTGDVPTVCSGLTGMFLDPPYIDGCNTDVYDEHNKDVRADVRAYALVNGDRMRIALCCYEGEHEMPTTWECYRWKAKGGYASQGSKNTENCKRETIYFSPMCLNPGKKIGFF
jgi:site-specific DNA-adenine methylase